MRQFLLLMLTLWSSFSAAVMVSDLYEVDVSVADQTAENREAGMALALEQVLIKVSGKQTVLDNPAIQQQLTSADRLVKRYRYARDEVDDSVRLQVIFAGNLIDRLLRNAGEPIWGKSRPLILIWQAVEEDTQRQFLNQDSGAWAVLVERVMSERGLPVLWPTLDLADELVLPLEKLWGLFKQDIQVASSRYQADAVVAGRLSPASEEGWGYSGILFHQQTTLALSAQAEDAEGVLRLVADQVASYFASQYAVETNAVAQPQGFQLQVTGVENFASYHELLMYLNSKVAINNVSLLKVDGTRLTLALDLAADWQHVWSVMALDKRLSISEEAGVLHWGQYK
ncbi:DUF2066 domain-containing protein [Bacterioplanoides sp.]|uniref:DUF2066 domain-containing protein n=1 Tax=Bacterioplanoides sp. TaxID=2066072 RepID=UPI003B5C1585